MAALAAGLTPIEVGSDLAGSLRLLGIAAARQAAAVLPGFTRPPGY